jgi:tRNA(fMet)-specific endonuclease VapC
LGFLLDTDVVIHLRDGDQSVWQQMRTLEPPLAISAISRVELESGVYREAEWAEVRRAALDKILEIVETLTLTEAEISAYRGIVEAVGYSRRKVSDRLTAATALVHHLTLVTMNGKDFKDVPGLALDAWSSPTT